MLRAAGHRRKTTERSDTLTVIRMLRRMSDRTTGPLKISVLIPCYNAAAYIGEALESVFGQGVELHEVIVVDDGSTDWSGEVVREFGRRVDYHRQANGGISRARNASLALATGDVVAFLDADDIWPGGSLASRAEALTADPSLGYVCGVVEHFVSPELKEPWASRHAANIGPPAAARFAGAMLVRRPIFERVGRFDGRLRVGETVDWVSRADQLGISWEEIPDLVLRRRLHTSNTGLTQRASRGDYLGVARAAIERKRAAG